MTEPPLPFSSSKALRIAYFAGGVVCLGLGVAGYILPLMPGTVFLILAAACFARSSPRFEAWLVAHPKLGRSILSWREHGAIPRHVKFLAIGAMAFSFLLVLFSPSHVFVKSLAGLFLGGCALFVGTRPDGPRDPGLSD
ncbi:MAG: YbaN family protein [Alphaproteobacteria bacterium]|nr:YbaN family protein [Alphaproteobacteria bacterium]